MVGSAVGAAIGGVAGGIAGLAAGQTPTPVQRSVIDGQPIEFDPIFTDNGYNGGGSLNIGGPSPSMASSRGGGPLMASVDGYIGTEPDKESTSSDEPWLRIPGPYDRRNWRANWMNLKAGVNSVERFISGPDGLNNIYQVGKWAAMNLPGFVIKGFTNTALPIISRSTPYSIDHYHEPYPAH